MNNNKGFTLIELVVVIVLLGILAAVAAPKFVDLQTEAKTSTVDAAKGAFESMATLVYSKSLIDAQESLESGSVPVDNVSVITRYGYPRSNDAAALAIIKDNLLQISNEYDVILNSSISTVFIFPKDLYDPSVYEQITIDFAPCVAAYREPLNEGERPQIASNPC